MARTYAHGGGCCGVRHLCLFTGRESSREIRLNVNSAAAASTLLEAVLTNGQLKTYPALRGILEAEGFRLVTSFRNGNSGSTCNVFHYNPAPTYANVAVDNLPRKPSLWTRFKNRIKS